MVQPDFIDAQRKKFAELLSLVKDQKPGVYNIKVAKVLGIGSHMVQPEVAIIKDTKGRVWAILEGKNLVSRYDVKKGTKLKVVV
ncbi:MAG: hypothetical protein Q7R84_01105 [bacterium]|nr:hypothetical protein [bacterium]